MSVGFQAIRGEINTDGVKSCAMVLFGQLDKRSTALGRWPIGNTRWISGGSQRDASPAACMALEVEPRVRVLQATTMLTKPMVTASAINNFFAYAFTNCVHESRRSAIYKRFATPESRNVGIGSLSEIAKIEFEKKSLPLLFIAGGEDHIIPASLNYDNFKKYSESPSRTDYALFPVDATGQLVKTDGSKSLYTQKIGSIL